MEYGSSEWLAQRFDHPHVTAAIHCVMEEVEYAQTEEAKGLNYRITTERQLIQLLRPSMLRHRLTIRPVAVRWLRDGEMTTKNDSVMQHAVLAVTYTLTHSPEQGEPSDVSVEVVGESADRMDKAAAKAMTMALKYALRQSFLIETGDDPDRYASQDVVSYANQSEQDKTAAKCIAAMNEVGDQPTLDKYLQTATHKKGLGPRQIEKVNAAYDENTRRIAAGE